MVMKKQTQMSVRLDDHLWAFLRKRAFDLDTSISALINECLEKYKVRCEKRVDTP